jgi:stage II sporulation protein D
MARIAIDATRGEVLLCEGKVINALYHACSGGYVTDCEDVWGKAYPYLTSHPDPFCTETPYSRWQTTLSRGELGLALRQAGLISGELKSMVAGDVDASGRVKYVVVADGYGAHSVSGQKLREIIGYSVLKSTLFRVDSVGGRFVFQGKGWGHGVGMAQWGAAMMGKEGYTTDEILGFYYPGTYVARIY